MEAMLQVKGREGMNQTCDLLALCSKNQPIPPSDRGPCLWPVSQGCTSVARKKRQRRRFVQKRQKKNRKPFGFRLFLVEVTGFEPATFWSRTKRATKLRYTSKYGANEGTRTLDLLITNQLLYRLSYIGPLHTSCTNGFLL